MATPKLTLSAHLSDFLLTLLERQDVAGRAKTVAAEVADLFAGTGVAVYSYRPESGWKLLAEYGEVHAAGSVRGGEGTLAKAAPATRPVSFEGGDLRREDYAHLGVRRTVASLSYLPLLRSGELFGVIEIVAFDRPLREDDLAAGDAIARCGALALDSAAAYESERNTHLDSINRLTQLYDLERSFNSTLQMETLLPIITAKVREVLNVAAANLWMVQGEGVALLGQDGSDPTVAIGDIQGPSGGIAGAVADSGTAVRIIDPQDPRLRIRNGGGNSVRSLLAVGVVAQGFLVAVLEVVNRADGRPFSEDDEFFLETISQTAASALHNASLLEAERKVEILETLVDVSREITSTLNLDRVLQAVVNGPQRIMEYDRAAIALQSMGRLQVKAISGKAEVVAADPSTRALREALEFCSISDDETFIVAKNNNLQLEDPEAQALFLNYFKQTGVRAWYCVPLADDQGKLGVLSLESKNPEFLTEAHLELVKVLAAQATVAVRNASLYTETPFIGVLEPLQKRRQQFMQMEKHRRAAIIGGAVTTVLVLSFLPFPMRVAGTASVAPLRSAQVKAPFDGVIRRVLVREGEAVAEGSVLAEFEDWDARTAVNTAQARKAESLAKMNRALAANDGGEAGIQRVQADYWTSELTRAQERLEHTRLRTPIAGVVSTPHLEDASGRQLQMGELIAEVVDTSHATVDVAIDQEDMPLLRAGDTAAVKLESFPTRTFQGTVTQVAPVGSAQGDERVFMARVDVPNADGTIHAGMQGRGKVSTGLRPIGYVMFRGLGMWAWTKLWNWFGW